MAKKESRYAKKPSKVLDLGIIEEKKVRDRKTTWTYYSESRIPIVDKYKEEYCESLVAHMSDGNSFESFAATINVPRSYLHNWVNHFKDFHYAKLVAEAKYMKWWEDSGKKGMANREFNASVWVFNMKNRFAWYDRNVTHVFPIQLERTLQIEDIESRIKALPEVPEMRIRDHIETV